MKVLILGKNSYLGNYIQRNLEDHGVEVTSESVRHDEWKTTNWGGYTSIIYCAAIVHQKDNSLKRLDDFCAVNSLLAYETAKKAKNDGCKNYIYISSNDVVSSSSSKKNHIVITKDSIPEPETAYSISKYLGEKMLATLAGEDFKVAIIRSPLIYGKGSPGNYARLSKMSKFIKVFPKISNKRSMIYVENLAEFIRLIAKNGYNGILYPQNKEYIKVDEMIKVISACRGKRIILLPTPKLLIEVVTRISDTFSKVFGENIIEKELSGYFEWEYNIYSFEESIQRTEQ